MKGNKYGGKRELERDRASTFGTCCGSGMWWWMWHPLGIEEAEYLVRKIGVSELDFPRQQGRWQYELACGDENRLVYRCQYGDQCYIILVWREQGKGYTIERCKGEEVPCSEVEIED